MNANTFLNINNRGFTLVEMAIVMIIVTVLMGGLMAGLTSQYDSRAQAQTEQTLADIREALLGYAVTYGRLPCPANPDGSSGEESPANGTAIVTGGTALTPCTYGFNGMIPGTRLSISPTDSHGYVLDGWGKPIHYAVTARWITTNASTNERIYVFTTLNGIRNGSTLNGTAAINLSSIQPDLVVCSTGTNVTASACDTTSHTLTNSAVAVIYSTGKNWRPAGSTSGTGGTSDNEKANPNPQSNNNDQVFVSHIPTVPGGPDGGEFDDIVTWISPYTLYSRMITAGQLP